MNTILCPTDFSKASENAVRYAKQLAIETDAKIVLLNVFATPVFYPEIDAALPFDYQYAYDGAHEALKLFYEKIFHDEPGKYKVELVIKSGLATDQISETALESKADLIVMGMTGATAESRFFFGSTALQVMKSAPCMVLLIPPKAQFEPLKTIAYTTDLTAENLERVSAIYPIAEKFNSEIQLVHVDHYFIEPDESEAHKIVESLVTYPNKSVFVCSDSSVSDAIEGYLEDNRANWIVSYTHFRNFLDGIIFPSVSRKIALHSTIPLLVIHPSDHSLSS